MLTGNQRRQRQAPVALRVSLRAADGVVGIEEANVLTGAGCTRGIAQRIGRQLRVGGG